MSNQSEKALPPAYGSYKTLTSFLNDIREGGAAHIPHKVDRSLMSKLSGSVANETIATLKFLGLIDAESGKTTEEFEHFALASDLDRKQVLAGMLKKSYDFIFNSSFDVERATSSMVAEQFRQKGISGSTLARAISFFLSAAKEAGIKVSPNIKPPSTPKNGGSKAKKEKQDAPPPPADMDSGGNKGLPPAADVHKFELPIPGKPSVVVLIPKELEGEDWEMFSEMFALYVKRWKGFSGKEKGPDHK